MEEHAIEGEGTLHVDDADPIVGSKGPFHPVYRTSAGEDRWGYYCASCGTVDNAMDTMGRIVCNECGNTRKPEEWDAAHE